MNDSSATWSARRPWYASALWRALGGWVLAMGLVGCAVNRETAAAAAEVDLSRLKAVYVVRSADDERGVYIAIVERLRQMGRSPSSGSAAAVPTGADAVLTYQAQWQWDVTMYLLELRVEMRDPRTAALLGMAVSHHTSLTRKTTAEMVDEALGNLFAGGERKPAAPAPGALANADVRLPAYGPAASRHSGPPSADVALAQVLDERRDGVGALIGERTTIGNISLGMIRLTPPPAHAVADVLRVEFEAMGWRVAADAPVRVAARITDFRVVTPATALYWDINGSIEIELRATKVDGKDRVAKVRSACTDRTFVYPSDSLIAGVVQSCLKSIGTRLREDAAWAAFVEGR